MCNTTVFSESLMSRARANRSPLDEMKRVNKAFRTFRARRLFSTMSQRWAVRLQGTPETSLATRAIVAFVAAQCAWICAAPHRRAIWASQRPLQKTPRFFRKITGSLLWH